MYRHGIDPEEIATAMDRPYSTVAYVLLRMAERGEIDRSEWGCGRRGDDA